MERSAGARPKSMPVNAETAKVKARIRTSGAVEIGCGVSGLTKKLNTSGAPTTDRKTDDPSGSGERGFR